MLNDANRLQRLSSAHPYDDQVYLATGTHP